MLKEPGKDKFSIRRRIKSFGYAFRGIRSFFFTTHNAWIHAFISLAVILAAVYFDITKTEWIAIIFAMGFVFAAEAFNTAIEQYVDIVKPEYDPRAGNIKDIAAGAVLIAATSAAIIGLLIFVPEIADLF